MTGDVVVTHQGRAVRAEIRTAAPVDRAWDAWADPARLSQWFTDRAAGRAAAGGTMTWYFDRFGSQFPYEVIVAQAPRRLVLKGSPPGRPPYILEILVSGGVDGGSCVSLVNSGFCVGYETDEEYEGVLSGWRMALAILRHYLENHYGRPKTGFFAMQPAAVDYDRILRSFLEEDGLMRWLTCSGSVGAPGERYRLTLRDGTPMSGRVLEVTSREAALCWDEIDGVAELKAFRLGPRARAVAVRGCGWGLPEDRAAGIERMLSQAIDRLVAAL